MLRARSGWSLRSVKPLHWERQSQRARNVHRWSTRRSPWKFNWVFLHVWFVLAPLQIYHIISKMQKPYTNPKVAGMYSTAMVELVHCTLRKDEESRSETIEWMHRRFPSTMSMNLQSLDYLTALRNAKSVFANIPRKIMRASLTIFLAKFLNYLTPGVVLGVRFLAKDIKRWQKCIKAQ